jgi:hypothetical protein
MQKFKSPTQTILNGPSLDKAILLFMNNLQGHKLNSICKKFCNQFGRGVHKGNWPKIMNSFWIIVFGDRSDVGIVDASDVHLMIIEIDA